MNILEKNFFGIAKIYGPRTTFSTGGRIKILSNFKFLQIHMYYISLDCKLFGDNKYQTSYAQKLIIGIIN